MAKKKAKSEVKRVKASDIMADVASRTGLPKTTVKAVIDTLGEVVTDYLTQQKPAVGDPGVKIPVVPKLISVYRKKRPATKERVGLNPATQEQIVIAARKAQIVTKAFVHKSLRDA